MNAEDRALIERDVEAYLAKYEATGLLRFVAVGSVDDGKSTLIGRLLHDTDAVFDDQLEAVRRASSLDGGKLDFSLFTDGLRAEREQGITIDVAYRYFATSRRKFIIADTPGHVQYTRNMVTGASTAKVALILLDARLGVLPQSRRHAYLASMLGIPHFAVCVNKMDLVGWDESVFDRIRRSFEPFLVKLRFASTTFFPISALEGDNVASPSAHMPWFEGGTVLDFLETVPIEVGESLDALRFPVQLVIRPHLDYRGFAGQIAAGSVRTGDTIVALPTGREAVVRAIDTYDGSLDEAHAPSSVILRLDREIDVSRGDMFAQARSLPRAGRRFEADLVWLSERPLDLEKTYVLKHTTQSVRVEIEELVSKLDLETLEHVPATTLELNDVGRAHLAARRALFYDAYEHSRSTGAFILVDTLTNDTVCAGMIRDPRAQTSLEDALREVRAGSALTPKTQVSPRERRERMGQRGATVWLVGLPGSGRWALAYALERRLFDVGRTAHVVDPTGEDLRSLTSAARACTDAGLVTICAFPSYRSADREYVRARVGADRFIEVFVNTSVALCRERRPDADFEGFEAPERPDVTVALEQLAVESAVDVVLTKLESHARR